MDEERRRAVTQPLTRLRKREADLAAPLERPVLFNRVDQGPAEFILESITNPSAYIEKCSRGTIGGSEAYRIEMPPSGPNAENAENLMTEQELADLIAFIESSGGR